jgi:hypothetical protein
LFGAIEPPLSIRAQEGIDVDTCKLNLLRLAGATNVGVFVEIARFGRLLLGLQGWTVLVLGKAARAVRSKFPEAEWFTASGLDLLLIGLSQVQRLQELLPDFELDDVLALVSKALDEIPYKDYESDEEDGDSSSFYSRVFRNKAVLDRPDTVFIGDPATLRGNLMDFVATITSALQISATDLSTLVQTTLGTGPVLSLETLSTVYRATGTPLSHEA